MPKLDQKKAMEKRKKFEEANASAQKYLDNNASEKAAFNKYKIPYQNMDQFLNDMVKKDPTMKKKK